MKQIIVNIDDLAYEPVVGMLKLCQGVEIESEGEVVDTINERDVCMVYAIKKLRNNNVFRHHYDYTWIMKALNEGVIEEYEDFESPQSFLDYLDEIGLDGLPDRSTLSRALSKAFDSYPNWTFVDAKKPSESIRRKNVVKQFLSAFGEAKRSNCTRNCTK